MSVKLTPTDLKSIVETMADPTNMTFKAVDAYWVSDYDVVEVYLTSTIPLTVKLTGQQLSLVTGEQDIVDVLTKEIKVGLKDVEATLERHLKRIKELLE